MGAFDSLRENMISLTDKGFLYNFFGLFREALASRFVGLTETCLVKKAEGEGEGKFEQ